MHQDVAILADPSFFEEVPASFQARRQRLRGIISHGETTIVEVFVLLEVIHHSSICPWHCAIEHIPNIEATQAGCITGIISIANENPIQILMFEVAHYCRLL
jgi:hypothetical protein